MHHGLQGEPMFFRSRVTPDILNLLVVHLEHAETGDFLCTRAQTQSIVMVVHNVALY